MMRFPWMRKKPESWQDIGSTPNYLVRVLEAAHDHTDSITAHLNLNGAIRWVKERYP